MKDLEENATKHEQNTKHLRTKKSIPGGKKNGKKPVILLYEDFLKENGVIVLQRERQAALRGADTNKVLWEAACVALRSHQNT